MQALKGMMFLMVAVVAFASFAQGANKGGDTGILAPGAKWEEISRIGLSTSGGVVADRNGMVYVSDISRAPIADGYYPCGTIWRYDPRTGSIDKFMQPSRISNGLHFDRNSGLKEKTPVTIRQVRENSLRN
jgi:hypothetical protein